LMFNKVTSRSYGYFFKFSYFFGREMESSKKVRNCRNWSKNRRNFRG
jgi:hypothetical protein